MEDREITRATVAKRNRTAFLSSAIPRPATPDFYSNKKRKIVEDPVENVDEEWEIPSDTKMAITALKRDFSQLSPDVVSSFPAIIMKAQLYYLMEDKTKADREVNELKATGEIMEMFVPGKLASDLFLCLSSDLAYRISHRIQTLSPSSIPFNKLTVAEATTILQFYRSAVVGKHSEPFIYRENLHNMFDYYLDSETQPLILIENEIDAAQNQTPVSAYKPKKNSLIYTPEKKEPRIKYTDMERVLIHEGWMTRRDVNSFWLSVPNFGRLARSLKKGRTYITGLLARAKFHEKMQAELLEMKKIPHCELSVSFVLKDMIGSGQLARTVLASGVLIRLNPAI